MEDRDEPFAWLGPPASEADVDAEEAPEGAAHPGHDSEGVADLDVWRIARGR